MKKTHKVKKNKFIIHQYQLKASSNPHLKNKTNKANTFFFNKKFGSKE